MYLEQKTTNGAWSIIWAPSRCGFRRGWLKETRTGYKYTFSVTGGKVSYMRVIEPKNVPKYVTLAILEKSIDGNRAEGNS